MTILAQQGGEKIPDEIYSGVVKRIQSNDFGKQKVVLSVEGGEQLLLESRSQENYPKALRSKYV